MLNKNVDTIIVGQNYLSYLLAFQLITEKHDVLILNDERIAKDDNHFKMFSPMEKDFIQAWGEDLGATYLEHLNESLSTKPFIVAIEDKEVLLGRDNPYQNLVELARKFPEFFYEILEFVDSGGINEQSFNESYYNMCERLGKTLCRFKTLQNFNFSTFSNHCPDYMTDIFEIFYKKVSMNGGFEDPKALFIYGMRAIFHDVLTVSMPKIEAFHLFCSLLGPRYQLDTSIIVSKLKGLLEHRGGNFRDSQIREWKFHKGRPWCVELNSFEGIIHPRKLTFIGGRPKQIPLKLDTEHLYGNYELTVKKNDLHKRSLPFFKFHAKYMGSQFPFWVETNMPGEQEETSFIKVFSKGHHGEKEDFIFGEIADLLIKDKVIDRAEDISNIKLGDDVISGVVAKSLNLPEKMILRDGAFALKGEKLKDVFYIGPCKKGPLGLLSSLMETKDFRHFL
jgi:hypothetical protein